jgi:predicted ATPase
MTAGINAGEVYLGERGRGPHQDVRAVGSAVNLAARLQQKAQPGQILVGESVYRHTHRAFAFARHEVEAKGFAEPVAAYEVVRALDHPEKVRGIEGLRAELIGREKELAGLADALAAVRAGRGQIVTLIGEAGVGKSRLIAELKELALAPVADQPRPLWLEGRCLDVGMAVSYWPFLDLLRAHFAFTPEDDDRARGARISAAVDALVGRGDLPAGRAEEMLPLLGHLLGARFGSELDERLAAASPEQIKHQTFLALVDLLVALARPQPLILVLEDLHWADSLSLDLVSLLMESLRLAPLLLVCVYRPEQEHKCWHLGAIATRKCHERHTEIPLKELTAAQSRRLVESLLHIEALPVSVKEQILGRAQGNPFFVEEVVRSLIDADLVYHDGSVWRARQTISELAVPESVQSVILSRVDRLEAEVKHVLQSAAVIGRLFRRRLVEQVAQKAGELDRALAELEDRQLIYEERAIPEEEYSFQHVLTQETVYHGILRRRRAVFHRQVAEALERLYIKSLDEFYEQLAYHYDQAGVVEKAVDYLLKAGAKARQAYQNEEALTYFQRALTQLEGDSLGAEHPEWMLEALQGLGHVTQALGQVADGETYWRRAITLGQALKLPARTLASMYFWLGIALFFQNRFAEQMRIGMEGLALLGDDTESVEAALMNHTISKGYFGQGRLEEAVAITLRTAHAFTRLPSASHAAQYEYLVGAHLFDKAGDKAQALVEQVDHSAAGDVHAVATMHAIKAQILFRFGDLRGAVTQLQASVELFARSDANDERWYRGELAEVLFCLGDVARAAEQAARTLAAQPLSGLVDARMTWLLGAGALCQGDLDTALTHLADAARFYQDGGWPWLKARAIVSLGRASLARGRHDEAAGQFEEALAVAIAVGERNFAVFPARWVLSNALSGIEEATGSPDRVRSVVERLWQGHSDSGSLPPLPRLHAAEAGHFPRERAHDPFNAALSPAWSWHDPYDDCSYAVQEGLRIAAANGRDLWHLNLSAPRMLVPAPSGDFAVRAVCGPVSDEQPAIGGLLLWQDKAHYLVLERGLCGAGDIAFRGCLDNVDRFLGRGRLPARRTWLRLERQGSLVRALCSADGASWLTAGSAEFPVEDPVEVGVHAIGLIDRTIYPGTYPDGTAIRFESFAVWEA